MRAVRGTARCRAAAGAVYNLTHTTTILQGVQIKRFKAHKGFPALWPVKGTPCTSLKSAAVAGSFHFRVRVWTINQPPRFSTAAQARREPGGRFRFARWVPRVRGEWKFCKLGKLFFSQKLDPLSFN